MIIWILKLSGYLIGDFEDSLATLRQQSQRTAAETYFFARNEEAV